VKVTGWLVLGDVGLKASLRSSVRGVTVTVWLAVVS